MTLSEEAVAAYSEFESMLLTDAWQPILALSWSA
jgi:hypothetical protein